jgi:hypothetical protein
MNPFKLFRRKKDDKEIIVDEKGEEVTIEDEAPKDEPIVDNPIEEEKPKVDNPNDFANGAKTKVFDVRFIGQNGEESNMDVEALDEEQARTKAIDMADVPSESIKSVAEKVATEVDSKEPIPENIEVQESEEVKTLKLELETIKAELEALKKAQVVEPEPEKEEDKTYEEFGLSYDAHFTDGSESNKKPRF